jgi:5-methylcytosine-specific restriction endonuclease McrA
VNGPKNSTILGEISKQKVLDALINTRGKPSKERGILYHDGRKYSIERLKVFAMHGCKCYNCGIEGTKIILTMDPGGGLHCDLYAVRNDGFTLMNRDHIVPASAGGKNNVWNLRPSCYKCNQRRGNHVSLTDKRVIRRRFIMGMIYRFLHTYRNKRKPYFSHGLSYKIASIVSAITP